MLSPLCQEKTALLFLYSCLVPVLRKNMADDRWCAGYHAHNAMQTFRVVWKACTFIESREYLCLALQFHKNTASGCARIHDTARYAYDSAHSNLLRWLRLCFLRPLRKSRVASITQGVIEPVIIPIALSFSESGQSTLFRAHWLRRGVVQRRSAEQAALVSIRQAETINAPMLPLFRRLASCKTVGNQRNNIAPEHLVLDKHFITARCRIQAHGFVVRHHLIGNLYEAFQFLAIQDRPSRHSPQRIFFAEDITHGKGQIRKEGTEVAPQFPLLCRHSITEGRSDALWTISAHSRLSITCRDRNNQMDNSRPCL